MAKVFYGTEIKLNVNIEPMDGITMDDYDFFIEVSNQLAKESTKIEKSEAIRIDANNYVVRLDTTKLGLGGLSCKVTAFLPDDDFEDGLRTEVVYVDTGITVAKSL